MSNLGAAGQNFGSLGTFFTRRDAKRVTSVHLSPHAVSVASSRELLLWILLIERLIKPKRKLKAQKLVVTLKAR